MPTSPEKFYIDLSKAQDGGPALGGKARQMAEMFALGLPVPAALAVFPDRCDADTGIVDTVARLVSKGPYYVRSSFSVEDGAEHSYAGQGLSIGHLDRCEVVDAIQTVWDSWHQPEAKAYRAQFGMVDARAGSVVVQQEIAPVWSGVLFTHNLDAIGDWARLEAVAGYGGPLVAGIADPCVLEFQLDSGSILHADGIDAPARDALVRQFIKFWPNIRDHFSADVDIEWCLDTHQKLWLLQIRPTTFEQTHYWSSVLSDEFWSGEVSPLMFSTVGQAIESAMLRDALSVAVDNLPRHLLRVYQGRVYVDVTTLSKALPLIPHWSMTDRVLDMFPEAIRKRYARESEAYAPTFPPALRRAIPKFFRGQFPWLPLKQPRHAPKHLAKAKQWQARPIPERAKIPAEINEILAELRQTLRWVTWGMLYAYVFVPLLDKLLGARAADPGAAGLYANLPHDPVDELDSELHAFVQNHDLGKQSIDYADLCSNPQYADIHQDYLHFIERWGHRAEERDIAAPRWLEHPAQVWELVGIAAQAGPKQATGWVGWLLKQFGPLWNPLRWPRLLMVMLVVKLARIYLGYRERMRDIADRYLLALRQRFLALAGDDLVPWAYRWDGEQFVEPGEMFSAADADAAYPTFLHGDEPLDAETETVPDGDCLSGLGVSPGICEGEVVWIRSIQDLENFKPNAILLAAYLDPSFSIVLESSAGAVFKNGGMLSHGAIIAREYGVPAIVGVAGLDDLSDGQRIRIDGNSGKIWTLDG